MTSVSYQHGARLRSIVDGDCFDSSIELEGVAIGGVDIEARFNGGAWAMVASAADGDWTGTLSGQSNGLGSLEIRVGETVQDSRANIYVGNKFSQLSSATVFNPTAPHTWAGRPWIVDRGDGVWVCVYRAALGHGDDSTAKINIRFSDDEGLTWSDENETLLGAAVTGVPFQRHNAGAGDNLSSCVIAVCPNGDLLALCNERPKGIYRHRSTDGGESWTDDGVIDNTVEADTTLIVGIPYVDGSRIWLSVRYEATPNVHPHRFRVYYSDDEGVTWAKKGNDVDTEDINEPCFFTIASTTKAVGIVRGEPNGATGRIYTTADISQATPTWTRNTAIGTLLKSFHYPVPVLTSYGVIIIGREYLENDERGVLYLWDATNNRPVAKSYFGASEVDGYYCTLVEKTNGDLYLMSYSGDTINAVIDQYLIEVV